MTRSRDDEFPESHFKAYTHLPLFNGGRWYALLSKQFDIMKAYIENNAKNGHMDFERISQ